MIDVLIPTKDRGDKISLTLLSLLFQTYTDLQIIVRDEGSTSMLESRTVRILWDLLSEKYTVQYIRKRGKQSISKARFELVRIASSAVIFFLDDDVVIEPFAIEYLESKLKERSFVSGVLYDVDNVRQHQGHIPYPVSTDMYESLGKIKKFNRCSEEKSFEVYWMSTAVLMLKRKNALKYKIFDLYDNISWCEDNMATVILSYNLGKGLVFSKVVGYHIVEAKTNWKELHGLGRELNMEILKDVVNREYLLKAFSSSEDDK